VLVFTRATTKGHTWPKKRQTAPSKAGSLAGANGGGATSCAPAKRSIVCTRNALNIGPHPGQAAAERRRVGPNRGTPRQPDGAASGYFQDSAPSMTIRASLRAGVAGEGAQAGSLPLRLRSHSRHEDLACARETTSQRGREASPTSRRSATESSDREHSEAPRPVCGPVARSRAPAAAHIHQARRRGLVRDRCEASGAARRTRSRA
jgi:hypothetical protein